MTNMTKRGGISAVSILILALIATAFSLATTTPRPADAAVETVSYTLTPAPLGTVPLFAPTSVDAVLPASGPWTVSSPGDRTQGAYFADADISGCDNVQVISYHFETTVSGASASVADQDGIGIALSNSDWLSGTPTPNPDSDFTYSPDSLNGFPGFAIRGYLPGPGNASTLDDGLLSVDATVGTPGPWNPTVSDQVILAMTPRARQLHPDNFHYLVSCSDCSGRYGVV